VLLFERTQQILQQLTESESLSVRDAIRLFNVSPATVRRDFSKLSSEGLVRRVRGGVAIAKEANGDIPSFSLRAVQHAREKLALANRAAELLQPDDVVIVEGGTTTCMLGTCIPDFHLQLITNSVRLASMLEGKHITRPQMEIIVTGGMLYPKAGILLGPSAEATLAQYHARWAFLSAGGITEAGVFTTNELVVELLRVMIRNAEKVVVMADHSKISRRAMCHLCDFDCVDMLITDECPSSEPTLEHLAAQGLEVLRVKVA